MGSIATDLANLDSAMAAVPTFVGATKPQIASVLLALGTAETDTTAYMDETDETIITDTVAGMVAAGVGLDQVLLGQISAAEQVCNASALLSVLGRMAKNLESLDTSGKTVTQTGGTLYALAAVEYDDETAWVDIAAANDLVDPVLSGVNTLLIPPTQSDSDGVYPQ